MDPLKADCLDGDIECISRYHIPILILCPYLCSSFRFFFELLSFVYFSSIHLHPSPSGHGQARVACLGTPVADQSLGDGGVPQTRSSITLCPPMSNFLFPHISSSTSPPMASQKWHLQELMTKVMMMRRWLSRAEPKVRGFPKPVTTTDNLVLFAPLA